MKKIKLLSLALMALFATSALATEKNYTFDDGVALDTDWTVDTDVPSGGTATCEITTSINNFAQEAGSTNYLGLAYLNKSGIGITITTKASYNNIDSISIDAIANDNSKPTIAAYIVTEDGDVEVFPAVGTKDGFATGGTNKWGKKKVVLATAVSGKLKIVTTASSSGKYAALDNITIFYGGEPPVPSTDSVAAATVTGANECYVGQSVTLTCTAAHATTYQWYNMEGEIAGATAKTYVFESAAAGSYGFYCMASNEYNVAPIRSNSFVVEVSPTPAQCGLLVSATTNGAVGGVATGSTIETNLGTGNTKKLDKEKYFGINLGIGAFQAGDTFAINITTGADLGKFMLYADKTGTELVFDEGITYTKSDATTPVICPTGLKKIVLPAAANGKSALYLYREKGNTQWNVTFDSIAITRSCEASSDATISRVYVVVGEEEQVFTQDADTFYFNIPYQVGGMTSIPVNYVLSHPAATATPASPFVINIPEPGQKVEQVVTVTAEDGTTTKAYTIRGIRNASLSNDATLKSLSVTGYTLLPAFASDIFEYTIVKPYGSQNPGSDKAEYEAAQGAHGVRSSSAEGDTIFITVTAEDGTTQLVYSIEIVEGDAPREVYEIFMSNGYNAYTLVENNVLCMRAFYLAGSQQPTIDSIHVNEGSTWAVDGEEVEITGVDGKKDRYSLVIEAVTPQALVVDSLYTLDGNESWIKGAYGFDASKGGWKFSKTDDDYSREIAGKTHVELFLPACDTLLIATGASGNERDVKFFINGVALGDKVKLTKAGIKVAVEQSAAFMLTVASAQTGGDGAIGAIKLIEAGEPPVVVKYSITVDGDVENGSVNYVGELASYAAGTEITLTNDPDEGFELDQYIVYKADDETVLVPVTDGKFIMPEYDVMISGTFKLIPVIAKFTVTLGTYEHGAVAFADLGNEDHKYFENDTVHLAITPEVGFELEDISLEGIDLAITVDGNIASFAMPARDVTVLATFKETSSQGFDNIDADAKAVKHMINGVLVIEKNGKFFNAQGAELR